MAVTFAIFSAYLTVYTVTAYNVATSHIVDIDEEAWWRTTPGGSLFPWPKESGMLQALSKVNETDLFIYTYLIKSSTLTILSALMWIFAVLCFFKAHKQSKHSSLKL